MTKLNLSMIVLAVAVSANASFANGGGNDDFFAEGKVDGNTETVSLGVENLNLNEANAAVDTFTTTGGLNDQSMLEAQFKIFSDAALDKMAFLVSIESGIMDKSFTIVTVVNALFNAETQSFAASIIEQLNNSGTINFEGMDERHVSLAQFIEALFALQDTSFQAVGSKNATDYALQDEAVDLISSFLVSNS